MTVDNGDLLRAVVRIDLPDQVESQGVFHWQFVGASGQTDVNVTADIRAQIQTIYNNLTAFMDASLSFGLMTIYEVTGLGVVVRTVGEDTPVVTPAGLGQILPHGTAAMIRSLTDIPKVDARKYIPGFMEEDTDDGFLQAGVVAALLTAANQAYRTFTGATTGEDYDPGVISSKQSAFVPTNTTQVVDNLIDYQRRRKPGVGS